MCLPYVSYVPMCLNAPQANQQMGTRGRICFRNYTKKSPGESTPGPVY